MRIAVAMSGGVDSSVAAALLKQQGHDVIGLTMQLMPKNDGKCCGLEAIEDARKAAFNLGIPHYIIDFRDIFRQTVITDFCREYSRGRTPNPCVLCNNIIKFGALMEKAKALDADFLATGHYARVERDDMKSAVSLKKGTDNKKDQSYFLCRLTRDQLSRTIFPVGNMTKEEVRKIAVKMGLPAAVRPESQEICFVTDDDHAQFVKNLMPEAASPGPVVNSAGKTLGEHKGLTHYTIGQRHGLGIAAAEPLYVTALLPDRNTVVAGTKEQAHGDDLTAGELNWIAGDTPRLPETLKAKIRYRHPEAEAVVTPLEDGNVYVKFTRPQMAITPGQTIAFYDGDNVAGGGEILRQGK